MSDTPETDAQLTTFTSVSKLKKHFTNRTGTVSAEFARKLERERGNLRDQRDFAMGEIEWLKKERDETRRGIRESDAAAKNWHGVLVVEYDLARKLERERDEAREALAEIERENEQLLASNKAYERDWPILVYERNELAKWINSLKVEFTLPEGRLWKETFLVEETK